MGNRLDYAEVRIEACTGDSNVLKFDQAPDFKSSRRLANQAASTLFMIALAGQPVGKHQGETEDGDWLVDFPDWAHITKVAVARCGRENRKQKSQWCRDYNCEHTMNKD
jgi:hypothetical protein